MEDNPQSSNYVDWPDEMDFPGGGVVVMNPNGPTDFGIGKYAASFTDSIGGCDMSFTDTAARGYAYKADDPRDVEYKFICTFEGIDPGNGMSISARTGHHTSDNCCQGFAYMFNVDPNTNPAEFRFRKEMWHVSYHDSPEGHFTHPVANFKLVGHGKVGMGFVIYNKPNTTDRVVLEGWFNPNPTADITNWTMVKRIEDFPGNNWGNDGGQCDGDSDQVGTWSGPQNRTKTNSTSGSVTFEKISFREIDPTRALDDTGGSGSQPPPPPPGGGGSTPVTVSPVITYAAISPPSTSVGTTNPVGPLGRVSRQIGQRLTNAMVCPDFNARYGPSGWERDGDTATQIGSTPCTGAGIDTKPYPDGLQITTYWSNSANACIAPGLATGTTGTNDNDVTNHGGRILKNPKIHLIFWGAEWNSRTLAPTMNQIIGEVRDKLLNTDRRYFDGIQQYGSPGYPQWGSTGTGTTPGTGTGTPTTTISEPLPFCIITNIPVSRDTFGITGVQATTMILSEELVETQTDPYVGNGFGEGGGWWGIPQSPTDPIRDIGDTPCDIGPNDTPDEYPDGLVVMAYWSNSHNNCITPGIHASDQGNSTAITYHNGRVMKNPVLRLIFWGAGWTTQTNPTKAQVISEIQNKLLGTDAVFFSGLNQYSGVGTPVYGSSCQNSNIPYPSTGTSTIQSAVNVIKDSIESGLLPLKTNSTELRNELYIVFMEKDRRGFHTDSNNQLHEFAGVHTAFKPSFTIPGS